MKKIIVEKISKWINAGSTNKAKVKSDPRIQSQFPIKFLALVLIFSAIAVSGMAWKVWDSYKMAKMIKERSLRIETLKGAFRHLDELLTMSVRMAATTGDSKWKVRFDEHFPLFNQVVSETLSLLPESHQGNWARDNQVMNIQTMAIDNQAFALIEKGSLKSAQQIVFDKKYSELKAVYAKQMERIANFLHDEANISLDGQRRTALFSSIAFLFIFPFWLLAWFIVLAMFRNWRKVLLDSNRKLLERGEELVRLNESLDNKVSERTKKYEQANEALRGEVSVRKLTEVALKNRAIELEKLNGSLEDARTAMLNVLRDFEEEKAKSELILSSVGEGIYGLDLNGNTTFVNPTALQMLGYTVDDELIGKSQHDLIHYKRVDESSYPKGECPIYNVFKTGTAQKVSDEVFWRKDNTCFPVEYTASPIEQDGAMVGVVVTFTDISERKRLQGQLLQSQKMSAIGKLAGGIAHDFNNILLVISGYCEFLLKSMEEEGGQYEEAMEIKNAADRAMNLTRQLLAFSRTQIINPTHVDLGVLIGDLDKMVRRLIDENIELATVYAEDLWPIKVDAGQMEQVLVNLVINARDAMPQGGKLTIQTRNVQVKKPDFRKDAELPVGDYVMLSVSDTGMGMSEEVRKQIFEPFFTTKGRDKGTGLGLATAYGIVKQNKGYIFVETSQGQGANFEIFFPKVRKKVETVKEAKSEITLPTGEETIFVAEDEESVRRLSVRFLKELGYTVYEASNGAEAMERIESHSNGEITLLLSDVIMPKMGGKELADKLKESRPEIKVLFMSGYTDEAIDKHGKLDKGVELLQKPFTQEALAMKVREVLDK